MKVNFTCTHWGSEYLDAAAFMQLHPNILNPNVCK